VVAMARMMMTTTTSEHPVCLFFAALFVAVLRLVCVPFVNHYGISISLATTHFLTGFWE